MSIETFLSLNFSDNMILSLQLLSVTENDVKIRPISINSEFILFIMNLLNSRYAYSNLNLEFWYTSLWHCTIHFKGTHYVSMYQETKSRLCEFHGPSSKRYISGSDCCRNLKLGLIELYGNTELQVKRTTK